MLIVMTNKHKGNVYSTIDNTDMRAQENIQSTYTEWSPGELELSMEV